MSAWDFANHPRRPPTLGTRHAVAAGHYLAAQVGFQILEGGGNAIDAGVGAGITLNVVESQMCSFSGVAPTMIYLADRREVVTIDGLGTWPAAASCAFFRARGHDIVPEGILQTVVPGAPDAWLTALSRWGTMSLGDVAAAAIRYARDGFPMHPQMSLTLKRKPGDFKPGTEAGRIFFPGGRAPEVGEIFVQADLARSLQYLVDAERAAASKGREAGIAAAREAFYRGDIARAFARHQRENGGLLTEADLAGYRATIEKALSVRYRGVDVYGCGPWCQGPLFLQQLNILAGVDLAALGRNSARYLHVIAEAVKLAAADREAYYGDPKFIDVPLATLLSESYAAQRRAEIRADRAWPEMPPAGRVPGWSREAAALRRELVPAGAQNDLDTSYVCAVDRHGNAYSATPSDGVMRGAPVVPGTGMAPSPRGIQSRLDPAHPSCVEPGKRPRLTPNPAIVVREGSYVMPMGTPGGDLQTQAMLQTLLNLELFALDIQSAIDSPRVYSYSFPDSFAPHAYFPGKLRIEEPFPRDVFAELTRLGHELEAWPADEWPRTGMCAIRADLQSGVRHAGVDFRRTGGALAG